MYTLEPQKFVLDVVIEAHISHHNILIVVLLYFSDKTCIIYHYDLFHLVMNKHPVLYVK